MQTERNFVFNDAFTDATCRVIIPEVVDPDYGMYTWPCAPVLAMYVWHRRQDIKGRTILEIGAGTALPSIVAGLCGANIHLSDSSCRPKCLQNCKNSCERNGLTEVNLHGITWGRFDPDIFQLPELDVIMASDCFYDTKDFEDIIVTIAFLLDQNKAAEFWCTYQERSSNRSIEDLLDKWCLVGRSIPLSDFNADKPCLAGSDLPGDHTIHLFIIATKQ